MELYNFFTTPSAGILHRALLDLTLPDLQEICHHVQLVEWQQPGGEVYYSIIGQMYGEDTNVGDTNLMLALNCIPYTWFDAFTPAVNSTPRPKPLPATTVPMVLPIAFIGMENEFKHWKAENPGLALYSRRVASTEQCSGASWAGYYIGETSRYIHPMDKEKIIYLINQRTPPKP